MTMYKLIPVEENGFFEALFWLGIAISLPLGVISCLSDSRKDDSKKHYQQMQKDYEKLKQEIIQRDYKKSNTNPNELKQKSLDNSIKSYEYYDNYQDSKINRDVRRQKPHERRINDFLNDYFDGKWENPDKNYYR